MNNDLTEYMSDLYRVTPAADGCSPHFFGGQPDLHSAMCPSCNVVLLQLCSIDCTAPPICETDFGPWTRIPLLFCWHCVNDLYYIKANDNAIHVFPASQEHRSESVPPYDDYPQFFERRTIELESGIPDDVKAIARRMIEEWESDSEDEEAEIWEPSDEEQRKLTDHFGHPVRSTFCLTHHQFGGHTLAPAWHDDSYSCPNRDCPRYGKKMTFLARILNAPHQGLPMVERFVSNETSYNYDVGVQYHICESCFALAGSNRTD